MASKAEEILWALAAQQAEDFNSSPFSQFVNDAGAEAGGKLVNSAEAIVQALMLPGDVASGKTPFDPRLGFSGQDPATLDRAANLAGAVSLGSMPIPRPSNSIGMGGRFTSTADIEDFAQSKGASLSLSENSDGIRVGKIVVPLEARGQGLGTEIMQAVSEYSNQVGKPVALTPSTDFGGSKSGLSRFYKGLGYQPNSGRNKDFRFQDTMILNPPR